MFRPSSPLSLALSASFTLRYVTIPSSATRFTITMASSASSLCIDLALLLHLGLKASARGTDPHKQLLHRVRSITFSSPTYLLYLSQIYGKDIGFGDHRHLPLCCGLPKVHSRLGCDFGSRFLQILHWLASTHRIPPRECTCSFLQAPLRFRLLIPSFQGFSWTSTNSLLTIPVAQSRIPLRSIRATCYIQTLCGLRILEIRRTSLSN